MLKILKKIFHKKEVYDFLSDEDKIFYDNINRGIPGGNLQETIEFLARLDAIKEREGIK